ncbi:MAG: hypothetical protein R3Y06_07275 [Faecalibacterium sp.]
MKGLLKKATSFYQKNIWFAIASLAQLGVILYFLVWLCTPAQSYTVPLQDLYSEEQAQNVALLEDGTLSITNKEEGAGNLVLYASPFSLAKGAYEVDIKTEFQLGEDGQTASFDETVASLVFYASGNSWQLKSEGIAISEAATQTSSRIWVNTKELSNLNFMLICPAGAVLGIESITLQENVLWRWLLFVVALLSCALFDVLYFAIFAQGANAVRRALPRCKITLALAGSITVASLPVFADFVYGGHDLSFHIARIGAVAQGLSQGQFPVRMMTEMLNGYGYANSIFYCDIFLYFSAFLYNCMLPASVAYQVYLVMVNIATCLIAYFCLVKICKQQWLAWLGASLYLLSAYRLLNVYTRAAAGEYTAMAFLPLLLLGIYGMYTHEKPKGKHWLPFALGMAGVVQSHILSLEIALIFTAIFCLLYLRKTLTLPRIKAWCCAAALSLGLSTWFLVPFLDYIVKISINVNTSSDTIQDTGLYLGQLFSLFGNTSGFSGLGTVDEMPLGLGCSLLLGAALAIYCLVKAQDWQIAHTLQLRVLRALTAIGLIATLFTLQVFPWDMLSGLVGTQLAQVVNVIQFSWRYLSVATVCLVFATVMALVILKQQGAKHYRVLAASVLGLLVLSTSVYQSSYYQTAGAVEWNTVDTMGSIVGLGEYLLGGVGLDDHATLDFGGNDLVLVQDYQSVQGEKELTCQNTSGEMQIVNFPVYAYPNYQVADQDTGAVFAITASAQQTIQVQLPANYSGTLVLSYQVPILWHIAEAISALSVLWVIGWIVHATGFDKKARAILQKRNV